MGEQRSSRLGARPTHAQEDTRQRNTHTHTCTHTDQRMWLKNVHNLPLHMQNTPVSESGQ